MFTIFKTLRCHQPSFNRLFLRRSRALAQPQQQAEDQVSEQWLELATRGRIRHGVLRVPERALEGRAARRRRQFWRATQAHGDVAIRVPAARGTVVARPSGRPQKYAVTA